MTARQTQAKSHFVDANGQRLYYREWSQGGPPLVLLHGVTSSNASWDAIAPEFTSEYAVLAFDLRGHGQSSKPERGYHWLEYAADITDFVKGHLDAPAILVGHSLGAMLTPIVAASVPEMVRAIVMEDPPAFRPREDRNHTPSRFAPVLEIKRRPYEERVRFAIESQGRTSEAARQYADDLEALSEHVLLELIAGGTAYSADEWFPKVSCSSLVILGNPERGGVVVVKDRPRLRNLLKDTKLVEWDDVGHGIHREQPARFVNEVKAFLKVVSGITK
ncbi:MAG: alpha/beta hydrolase [Chloroflexi bacterium]|nr:alpha/beta hydrolase [Chloroflexota bacterium]